MALSQIYHCLAARMQWVLQKTTLECITELFCPLQPAIKEQTSDSLHQDNLKTKKRGSEHANAVLRPGQNSLIEVKHDVQKPESKAEGDNASSKSYGQQSHS